MILEESLNNFLRLQIDNMLATPAFTIKAMQTDAPRPQGAYATVNFVSELSTSTVERNYIDVVGDDTNITVENRKMREVMFSLNFFRSGAIDNARTVTLGVNRESVLRSFNLANIGFTRMSDVRRLSLTHENSWEERAQLDIFLSIVGSDSEMIEAIRTASMRLIDGFDNYEQLIEVQ